MFETTMKLKCQSRGCTKKLRHTTVHEHMLSVQLRDKKRPITNVRRPIHSNNGLIRTPLKLWWSQDVVNVRQMLK